MPTELGHEESIAQRNCATGVQAQWLRVAITVKWPRGIRRREARDGNPSRRNSPIRQSSPRTTAPRAVQAARRHPGEVAASRRAWMTGTGMEYANRRPTPRK
jgi:hypothetical protein